MKKAKARAVRLAEARPVGPNLFQQREGSVDIGVDEIFGPADGPIDMALGGKVHDGARLMACQCLANQFAINDVALHEMVAWIVRDAFQVVGIAGVGEFIEIYNGRRLISHPLQDEVRADKARSTGDHN